jgi:hypothetical protein
MANLYSQFTYDNALLLKAAGLVAASTDSGILDLGPGLVDGYLVLDVSAIETDSANEIFTISLEGSSVAAMTSGSVCLAKKVFGQLVVPMDNALTTPGRYVVPFRNEEGGTLMRYVRVSTLVAGTIATGINFMAFIAMEQ